MGYKKKIAEARQNLNTKLPKEFSVFDFDVWSQVAKTAGVEMEHGGVPVQGERHLITSWAAMSAGVNLAMSLLRTEHRNTIARIRAEYGERLDDKDIINESQTGKLELEKENAAIRALPHISDENERKLVAEELAS